MKKISTVFIMLAFVNLTFAEVGFNGTNVTVKKIETRYCEDWGGIVVLSATFSDNVIKWISVKLDGTSPEGKYDLVKSLQANLLYAKANGNSVQYKFIGDELLGVAIMEQ